MTEEGISAKLEIVRQNLERLEHLYDRIDPEIVYRILTQNRAELEDLARLLVTTLSG